MRILSLGGSGRTGKLVIDEALERGHQVTALVRNPASLEVRDGLTISQGTPLERRDIEAAIEATLQGTPDVVIVTLNSLRTSDNPFAAVVSPPRMMADSVANTIAVMKEQGIKKIVILQAIGVGDSLLEVNCLLRGLFNFSNMRSSYDDHDLVDKETKSSGVQFVLARPVMLAEGAVLPIKEYGNTGKGVSLFSKITRRSVAKFLVDAAQSEQWDGSTPVLSN